MHTHRLSTIERLCDTVFLSVPEALVPEHAFVAVPVVLDARVSHHTRAAEAGAVVEVALAAVHPREESTRHKIWQTQTQT